MSEVNFAEQSENTPENTTSGQGTDQAPPPQEMAVARAEQPLLGDTMPSFADIILPRINIVQNIGILKDTFEPGCIVFGQTTVLWTPPKFDPKTGNSIRQATAPVEITVLGFRPLRYVERTTGGVRGRVFNTEQQVLAAGGTLDYNEWQLKQLKGIKLFQPLAEAMVLIARPDCCKPATEDDESVFVYTVDGKRVTIGLWAMKGTSYTAAAKRVFFTARRNGCLREGGYPSWSFGLTCVEQTQAGNRYWVPACTPMHRTSPATLEWIRETISAPPKAAAAEADGADTSGE